MEVYLDIDTINDTSFVGKDGLIYEFSVARILAHEVIHVLKGLSDTDPNLIFIDNFDFHGDTENLTNKIMQDLELEQSSGYFFSVPNATIPNYPNGLVNGETVNIDNTFIWDQRVLAGSFKMPETSNSNDIIVGSFLRTRFSAPEETTFFMA